MTNLERIDNYLKFALNVAWVDQKTDPALAVALVEERLSGLSGSQLPFTEQPGTTPQAE